MYVNGQIYCFSGVTTFAQSSGSSNFAGAGAGSDNINDFDFKDTAQTNNNFDAETAGSDNAYNTVWAYPTAGANSNTNNNNINSLNNNNHNALQYQDMANYLQQPAASLPQFSPIGANSLFGNSAYANDYATTQIKPTAIAR